MADLNIPKIKKLTLTPYFDLETLSDVRYNYEQKYNKIYEQRKDPNSAASKEKSRIQQIELERVNRQTRTVNLNTTICRNIKNNSYRIEYQKLLKGANKQFYDWRMFELLACISGLSITATSPYLEPNNPNLKSFWGNVRKLSAGAYGEVYETTKEELNQAYIIKYYMPNIGYDTKSKILLIYNDPKAEVIHELFIAAVLNNFRKSVPNFMYGYGYFNCSNPFDTKIKRVRSVCDMSGTSYYGIFEKISPGIQLKTYLIKGVPNLAPILGYYLQILFALETISVVKFTHYDLHTANIIFRSKPKKTLIRYINPDTKKYIYLDSEYVATIIDYGQSYLEYKGNKHGVYELESGNIYPDMPNLIVDAFKPFMFMIEDLVDRKDELGNILVRLLTPIYHFFDTKDSIKDHLDRRNNNYYFEVPASDKTKTYRHSKLIKYILSEYYPILNQKVLYNKVPKGYKVLNCRSFECRTTVQVVDDSSNGDIGLMTIFDYIRANKYNQIASEVDNDKLDTIINKNLILSSMIIGESEAMIKKINTILNAVKGIIYNITSIIKSYFGGTVQNNLKMLRVAVSSILNLNMLIGNLADLLISRDGYITLYRYFKRDQWMRKIENNNTATLKVFREYEKIKNYILKYVEDYRILLWKYYQKVNELPVKVQDQFVYDFNQILRIEKQLKKKFTMLYQIEVLI